MRLLYSNENRLIVANFRNIVESAGIEVTLKNEFAAGGMGGLPPLEVWPELWVVNDADYERAKTLIESSLGAKSTVPWRCTNCGEDNDPSFEACWKCGHEPESLCNRARHKKNHR
ncbi:MAG: DUF2007 domain-containing protein [Halieaceae bacterium]|uniref:putative signal transducing protein n=1 Tax=Haliea alexandrii TaxID=2448162 RepID=UPI000F0BC7FD|nr:DUF2007 domain-containing protein [Haliea alexandrii]MCR9185694.1 DUF2007 domain-containing protein [Halieaceae bacterium]